MRFGLRTVSGLRLLGARVYGFAGLGFQVSAVAITMRSSSREAFRGVTLVARV